ncbi:MAG: hypothetical protein Q9198_001180 [Flavoplaca austrocitrina]
MDLPNEVTLNIVSCLSKKDLKQVRLVCRLWAALAAKSLFDTIYVSPREIDMTMFEAITRHPTLRNAPRNLVYDSAVFPSIDELHYATLLHWQYHRGTFDALGDARFAVEKMIRFVSMDVLDGKSVELDKQLRNHPVFQSGFREHSNHAGEFLNLFTKRWSGRVRQGLKKLGPIVSVTIRNTWEMIYDYGDNKMAARGCGYGFAKALNEVVEPHNAENLNSLVSSNSIRPDGTRLVGSPSARAYPATGCQPYATQDWNTMDETQMMRTCNSSGFYEFIEMVNLLALAGKRAKSLAVMPGTGIDGFRTGIAAHVFDPKHNLDPKRLLRMANGLTSLQLTIADNVREDDCSLHPLPNCEIFDQFLWRAQSLEMLSLDFPCDLNSIGSDEKTGVNLCRLFHKAQRWLPTRLKELHLSGFTASYRELGTHLFLCLPLLVNLTLSYFALNEGCYEDFLRGLQQHAQLQNFEFGCLILRTDDNGVNDIMPPAILEGDPKSQEEFFKAIRDFVSTGKVLPELVPGERDLQYNEWLQQMKTERNQLMSAYIGQDTSGRRQQSFPHSAECRRFVAKAVANYKSAPSMYK